MTHIGKVEGGKNSKTGVHQINAFDDSENVAFTLYTQADDVGNSGLVISIRDGDSCWA